MKPNVSFREAAAFALGPKLQGCDRLRSANSGPLPKLQNAQARLYCDVPYRVRLPEAYLFVRARRPSRTLATVGDPVEPNASAKDLA